MEKEIRIIALEDKVKELEKKLSGMMAYYENHLVRLHKDAILNKGVQK